MPAISGKKLVFTGGASQVGSHIGEQLLAGGAREVELLDNLSLGSIETSKRCWRMRGAASCAPTYCA